MEISFFFLKNKKIYIASFLFKSLRVFFKTNLMLISENVFLYILKIYSGNNMGQLEGLCVKYLMKYEEAVERNIFFLSAHTRAINNVICEHKENHDLYVMIVHDVELNTMYMRITTTWYKHNV